MKTSNLSFCVRGFRKILKFSRTERTLPYISRGKSCLTIVDKFSYHPRLKQNSTVVTYNTISTKV